MRMSHLRFPINLKNNLPSILLLCLTLCTIPLSAQEVTKVKKERKLPVKQHMIGVRGTYAITGVNFNPDRKQETVPGYRNGSLLYTYYHDLWGNMPYFGIQTGVTYCQSGFKTPSQKRIYDVIQVPLIAQFHIDFWKMRLLINLGCFGGYRMSAVDFTEEYPNGTPVVFDVNHHYADFGLQGGGGLAFSFHPFEIQFECNYQYSLSLIENPALYSNEVYTYGYPNQLMFSLGLFFHL